MSWMAKKDLPKKRVGDRYDHENDSVEIEKIKKSLFDFSDDPDIEEHRWKEGLTYRAFVTRDGKPSILGWKIIRLALMGKSWRYMSRVTGIRKTTISNVFRTNEIIRQATLGLATEVAEEAKMTLWRYLHKSAVSLVKLAAGESQHSTADKMKVQLEAIKEHFNRIGFAMPTAGRGGNAKEGDFIIRVEGPEAKDLGILISRRREMLPKGRGGDVSADGDTEDAEEEGPEGSGTGDDGSVAESGEATIEGKFTEKPERS